MTTRQLQYHIHMSGILYYDNGIRRDYLTDSLSLITNSDISYLIQTSPLLTRHL